jgi:hypothetical protein
VICAQTPFALAQKHNPVIAAWMHGDEPDNAQSLGAGKGYGPPILPEVIITDYERLRAADDTRPVFLNLGQGVAWDNYIGRGVRRNHPEDYPEYIKGGDIISFDIYPVVHDSPEIRGKLEFVPRGVERLVHWSDGKKMVWNCIECTHISNPPAKATPAQVRSEVWMSLIHGSRGLVYFVHQFKPDFREAALLADSEMLAAVTAINAQIKELAPVLNSPTLTNQVTVKSDADLPIATMFKEHNGQRYLFAAAMRNAPGQATFQFSSNVRRVEVLGESRQVEAHRRKFTDRFEGYAVHLYRFLP